MPQTTVIGWLRDLLSGCPALASAAGVTVDQLKGEFDQFSIDPLPGAKLLAEDLDGTRYREFPFTVSSFRCTAEEANRLESNGVFAALADWMEELTDGDQFPAMPGQAVAEELRCTSWGYLFQQEGDPTSAIYQISCVLRYRTEPA